jgi:hypothetical protein
MQEVMFPAYPSLRKIAGIPGEKNSKPQPQGHKGLKYLLKIPQST